MHEEQVEARKEHALETYRSLVTLATQALKALQLLNGGAVVALLAYLGQISNTAELARLALWPLVLFIVGLVAATGAYFGAYFTQLARFNESVNRSYGGRSDGFWLLVTIVLSLMSLGLFAAGAIWSAVALTSAG